MTEGGNHSAQNIDHNKAHYDSVYKDVNINSILKVIRNLDSYLEGATSSDISWVGMYKDNFKNQVKEKTVLELGCGDCTNAAVLAALGAKVVANDISDRCADIIEALNKNHKFNYPIKFLKGDFTKSNVIEHSFDFVIGKAFLHHLTLKLEYEILKKITKVLKPTGEARFFETAVNSKVLDELRWAVPMNNRPSKWFQPKAFRAWENSDPHPPRDNSSKHYKEVGNQLFNTVKIIPLGIFERFSRLLPGHKKKKAGFKKRALWAEHYLPIAIRSYGARSQVIIYRKPKTI